MEAKENASSNSLSLACRFFETEANEELYVAASSASPKKLCAFLEQYRIAAFEGFLDPPKLDTGTLRLYLSASDGEPWLWGRFSFGFSTLEEQDRIWSAVDAIKHRLLYCHSVAVKNPLNGFFFKAFNQEISTQDVIDKRSSLLNFISFLLHMKPIIDRGIFSLISDAYLTQRSGVPFICNLFRKFGPDFGVNNSIPDIFTKSDAQEFYTQTPPRVQKLYTSELFEGLDLGFLLVSSRTRILDILGTFGRAPASLSLYFPFRADIAVMSAFLDNFKRSAVQVTQFPRIFRRPASFISISPE